MTRTKAGAVNILLVDDDLGHVRLIEKNLRRADVINDIHVMTDGQQILDYVFAQEDGTRDSDCLIVLDLNLPAMDGHQVLERIKADERTRRIPVIVLTTADDPAEIARCYELGCNVYITKPVDYEDFSEVIQKLGLFLSIMEMPGKA